MPLSKGGAASSGEILVGLEDSFSVLAASDSRYASLSTANLKYEKYQM